MYVYSLYLANKRIFTFANNSGDENINYINNNIESIKLMNSQKKNCRAIAMYAVNHNIIVGPRSFIWYNLVSMRFRENYRKIMTLWLME